jgi:hypothetical protein
MRNNLAMPDAVGDNVDEEQNWIAGHMETYARMRERDAVLNAASIPRRWYSTSSIWRVMRLCDRLTAYWGRDKR